MGVVTRSKRFRAAGAITAMILLLAAPASGALFRSIDGEGASVSGSTLRDNGFTYVLDNRSSVADSPVSQGQLPSISSTYSQLGAYSIRSRILPDSDGLNDRSEVLVSSGISMSQARWVRFWMYVPPSFTVYEAPRRQLFTQLKQDAPHFPPFALYFEPGSDVRYQVVIKHPSRNVMSWDPSAVRFADTLPKGQWVQFVIGWRADPTGPGWIEVWRDGSMKYRFEGPWGYTAAVSPRQTFTLKFGLYGAANLTGTTQSVYFDGLKYGDTKADVDIVGS